MPHAAIEAAAMQAPPSGMVLDPTQSGLDLTLPIMVATLLATVPARSLDECSIHSARPAAK